VNGRRRKMVVREKFIERKKYRNGDNRKLYIIEQTKKSQVKSIVILGALCGWPVSLLQP
jgi:phage regulator Rha-like protein